ncbi:hypothetical protein B0T16DRAFT_324280 [Cercophora newfieldiana]|uniref:C2H2-type domain-containing protein n=1 Tax=Cercophora newfieldiana TaxID=92897 RepID=A0AA39YBI0_9PEZI|nr:hypothetical protein B0T16DRAFT_324280 [Cercophora newfieldiana]
MSLCPCSCGRSFQSAAGLAQHRAAKHSSQLSPELQHQPLGPATQAIAASPRSPPRSPRPRDSRLWKGLLGLEPIATIGLESLRPSNTSVSISTPSQLVCSYNWQSGGGFQVPGYAPIWQNIALPTSLPRDPKLSNASKPTFTTSMYPFEQIFQATAVMDPDFRFNKIDIVTTRNSLRKFLDFCSGRRPDSFRVNLSLVENTLFIEQHNVINMAQGTGWGHSFEKAFTRYPPGFESSTTHDRFLQYPLGDLNCLVGFEVDACYRGDGSEPTQVQPDIEELQDGLGEISLNDSATPLPNTIGKCSMPRPSPHLPAGTTIMPQSAAAELKTCKVGKSGIAAYLPQLWFGRTSWLIVASHKEGTFINTKIMDVASRLTQWEVERQDDLRMLAAFLAAVREAMRKCGRTRCSLMYEKAGVGSPNVVKLFNANITKVGRVVPEEAFHRFWS